MLFYFYYFFKCLHLSKGTVDPEMGKMVFSRFTGAGRDGGPTHVVFVQSGLIF